ncbi:HET domain-containing protein [Microdochium nivale]|nr:HET domain-containing protein [Microdochium nivale]
MIANDDDDKDQTLLQLSQRHGIPIISQLVSIADKGNQREHKRLLSFVTSLECLQPRGQQLTRASINAVQHPDYVALSYTWDASEHEDPRSGRFQVQDWGGAEKALLPSTVRNCVLDRVSRYMKHISIRYLWIDAHCIRQPDCKLDDCESHPECVEQRDAVQVMDLVYQLSRHPVALLGRKVDSSTDLDLLHRILAGSLVTDADERSYRLASTTADGRRKARLALQLLDWIMADSWWQRAWTFQENYRAGERMCLLVPHDRDLELQKRRLGDFGTVPGEICISSVGLSVQATRLCMAMRQRTDKSGPTRAELGQINHVMRAFSRYARVLDRSRPTTPVIVADVEARGVTKVWDRLAIVANCCKYPTRLDSASLRKQRHSPSLSMLAMCLLNGEILDNRDESCGAAPMLPVEMTASKFLETQMFAQFLVPTSHGSSTRFIKRCRLTNVSLEAEGIVTRGSLWRLSTESITSSQLDSCEGLGGESARCGHFKPRHWRRLLQLVTHLYNEGHGYLAGCLRAYLEEQSLGMIHTTPAQKFRFTMVHEIATAMLRRDVLLRLGTLWNEVEVVNGHSAPYRAIFILPQHHISLSHAEDGHPLRQHDLPMVFTSFSEDTDSAGGADSWQHPGDPSDRYCHVSLAVVADEVPSQEWRLGLITSPRLRVSGWMHGICFPEGDLRITRVVLPWPRSLVGVEPR